MRREDLRLPPHSIESEQSVLGALMLNNQSADRIGGLRPEHFFRDDHRRIFSVVMTLINSEKPADVLTVFQALESAGEADRVGGLAYLGEIANNTPSAANIGQYARTVIDRALLRSLMSVGDEIAADCQNLGDPREKIDAAQAKIMALGDMGGVTEPALLRDILISHMDVLNQRMHGEDEHLLTGFADIDNRSRILRPGKSIVVAARPGMGKTAFALRLAMNVAEAGSGVLFLSMEMTRTEIVDRIISMVGRIPFRRVMREEAMNDDDWDRLTTAVSRFSQMKMSIDDKPALTLFDVRTKARQAKRKLGSLSVVVVDYIGLMRGEGENRTQQVGSISRGLKALALEQELTIVALSQLNRDVESRPNRRPTLSDLRESGEIEQDADVVLSLYRDEQYDPNSRYKGLAELGWLKNRGGASGGISPLAWIGEFMLYGNADHAAFKAAADSAAQNGSMKRGALRD